MARSPRSPPGERQIRVSSVIVSPNGIILELLAARFAQDRLTISVAGVYSLSEAGRALSEVLSGRPAGGVVIAPRS